MQIVLNSLLKCAPINSQPLVNQDGYYLNLLSALGFNSKNPPLGDFLRYYHALDGQWLVASPIYWEAKCQDAYIVAADETLGLTKEDAYQWFKVIADFLKTSGIELVYHNATTWLLNRANTPALTSSSVNFLLGKPLMNVLKNMDSTLFWQRLLTELQMYLSAHPLHMQQKVKYPINGLWFWGEPLFENVVNKTIVTSDEKFIELFGHMFTRIYGLSTCKSLEKNSLVLVNNLKKIDLSNLRKQTQKMLCEWYWNDRAYVTKRKYWWQFPLS